LLSENLLDASSPLLNSGILGQVTIAWAKPRKRAHKAIADRLVSIATSKVKKKERLRKHPVQKKYRY